MNVLKSLRFLLVLATVSSGYQSAFAQAFLDSFSGFKQNSDAPVDIEADKLEVTDKENLAVFSGNVFLKQDTVTMRAQYLEVHYKGTTGEISERSISLIKARGGLIIRDGEQTATGDRLVIDLNKDEAQLIGDVSLEQKGNTAKAERLVVDIKTGKARLVNPKDSETRVRIRLKNTLKP